MLFSPNLGKKLPNLDKNSNRTNPNATTDIEKYSQSTSTYYHEYNLSFDYIKKLKKATEQAIQQLNFETAVFLAELLYTECAGLELSSVQKIESVYLYALAMYMNKDYHTASIISEKLRNIHIGIAYLYGRCALELSKNEEGACLSMVVRLDEYENDASLGLLCMPNTATIHCLIAKMYQRSYNTKSCIHHHLEALKLDPYLWESYIAISDMKANIDIKTLFFGINGNRESAQSACNPNKQRGQTAFSKDPKLNRKVDGNEHTPNINENNGVKTNSVSEEPGYHSPLGASKPVNSNLSPSQNSQSQQSRNLHSNSNANVTPSGLLIRQQNQKQSQDCLLLNNQSNAATVVSTVSSTSPTISSLAKMNSNKNKFLTTPPSKLLGTEQRTSFKTPRNIINSNNMSSNTIRRKLNLGLSNNMLTNSRRKYELNPKFPLESIEDTVAYQNGLKDSDTCLLKDIMYIFVKILKASSQYNSHNAIRLMNEKLPSHILNNMPWCQAQLGKLHYEISNYDMSLQYFNHLRELQPTRVKDLEIFSTLLWHLRDSYSLSTISDELIEIYPKKPETWCVLGNYFSLTKDHEEAIKAFERATDLNPRFAYAYTLQGHEHVSKESFDSAKALFRKAIACDPQHYNAYYGLGDCVARMGKYDEALLYFEKARIINPVNIILICCCGNILEKLYYQEKALNYYELACKLQPGSTIPKYKKAQLLFAMGRFSVAMELFEELTKLSPEEATVHFMLGQIYQTMGRKNDAIREYTVAINLDPMGSQVIMDALEKCHMQE